jgi:hypothetical protein
MMNSSVENGEQRYNDSVLMKMIVVSEVETNGHDETVVAGKFDDILKHGEPSKPHSELRAALDNLVEPDFAVTRGNKDSGVNRRDPSTARYALGTSTLSGGRGRLTEKQRRLRINDQSTA